MAMSGHNNVEAEKHAAKLINHALAGEEVVTTRQGRPVFEPNQVSPVLRQATAADIDWVVARRRGQKIDEDAGTFVSRMRDEEWER